MDLWCVGKFMNCDSCDSKWYMAGVYDTEKKAVESCITDDYFVGPVKLNKPSDSSVWKGCYYPLLETQQEADKRIV